MKVAVITKSSEGDQRFFLISEILPSVLWDYCWFRIRKGIQPVNKIPSADNSRIAVGCTVSAISSASQSQ